MERSQSCSDFDTTVSTAEPGMRMPAYKAAMAQLKQSNSQILLSNTQNHQTKQTVNNYPTATTLRRKNFQRQRTATFSDDTEYAGDLDEEPDEEDEVMHVVYETIMPGMLNTYARQRTNFHPTLPAHSETTYNATARVVHYTKTSRLSHSTPAGNDTKTNTVLPTHRLIKHEESFDSSSTTADTTPSPTSPRQHYAASLLTRDNSLHSDSSRYSSVDSLLEARKPDPEAILINLGFGPAGTDDILSRIPKRFLKPSQVPGNDTEAFVKRLQLANNLADHSVLGYRGLTGNPDIPPSSIVAKIMQRFEVNERKKSMGSIEHAI